MRVYIILLLLAGLAVTTAARNIAGSASTVVNPTSPRSIIAPALSLPPNGPPMAQAQGPGVWRTYTNSNCLSNLMAAGDYIWGATCAGLIRWNRADGHYVRYTTADGLAGNRIAAMASDREGRVWIGAAGKVSVFEGQRWATYPVSDDWAGGDIRVMAAGPAGQLWVGTSNGVRMFDGQRCCIAPSPIPAAASRLATNPSSSSVSTGPTPPAAANPGTAGWAWPSLGPSSWPNTAKSSPRARKARAPLLPSACLFPKTDTKLPQFCHFSTVLS